MTNGSSRPVVLWGVHAYPRMAIGGALEPGASGTIGWREVLDSGSWWQFHDAFWGMEAQGLVGTWDENWPFVMGNLANMALESGMVDVPSFGFAVTEQPIVDVQVDGRTQEVPGLKLDLFPIPADRMGETGWAYARPVWLDEAFRAGGFEGAPVFAELWILSYRLPTDLSGALPAWRWAGWTRTSSVMNAPPPPAEEEEDLDGDRGLGGPGTGRQRSSSRSTSTPNLIPSGSWRRRARCCCGYPAPGWGCRCPLAAVMTWGDAP